MSSGPRFANTIAPCGLDLSGEAANLALKLNQVILPVFQCLLQPLSTNLSTLNLCGIGCRLPLGRKHGCGGLMGSFGGRDIGNEAGIPRRSFGIRAKGGIVFDALANMFKCGFRAAADFDCALKRFLLLLACSFKASPARVKRRTLLT